MHSEPQPEHGWLEQLVGDWSYESSCIMGPDQPPSKHGGTESVRSLGGLWTVGEGTCEMPGGGTGVTMMTLGYDAQKKRYVGTWVGSMMNYLWIYDGELDAAKRILTLESEGPSMAGDGTLSKYRDVIEIVDSDHRTLSSYMPTEDGKWQSFNTAHYRRTSKK